MRSIGASALALALLLTACSDASTHPQARAQRPGSSSVTPRVVRGQAPVVWVSGRLDGVGPVTVTVVEQSGARLVLRRLAKGATRFFRRTGGSWTRVGDEEVPATPSGTPVCAEALRDRGVYLAIRVFLGAACGPTG